MTHTPTRRQILGAGLALPLGHALAPAARALGQATSPGKLLVLGGTRFLGPAVVDAALERGWEVTLFNRGKSNPGLYPDLEQLRGDRDTGDLDALKGREWDLVVDTSLYLPSHAGEMAAILADSVGHYVMISTISVYEQGTEFSVDESGPVGTIALDDIEQVTKISDVYRVGGGQFYGPLKALCEQELEGAMPGRVTSLRPGVIAGRDDPSDRLPYWVVRAAQGGEILAPEPKDLTCQFTDVRDLGIFSVDFGAAKTSGTFNAAGFPEPLSMEALLHACAKEMGSECSFTWASEEFLLEHKVRPFATLPFWLPTGAAHVYPMTKGIEAGMRFRPIAETIRETAEWFFETRDESYKWRVYGMQPERERELLDLLAAAD